MTDRPRLRCSDVDDLAGLYVLDALGPEEAAEVAAHLADHAERHPSFAELAGVTPFLAEFAEPFAPPPALRASVMAAIATTPQEAPPVRSAGGPAPAAVAGWSAGPGSSVVPGSGAVSAGSEPVSIDRARERRAARPRLWTALAAAAVLAIVVLGGWNLLLQRQATDADHRLALLSDAVAAAGSPGSTVALMTGSDTAAGAGGYAVFPANGTGYIVLTGLPPAPSDQTWQAWTLADGQPASAGLMTVGSDGLAVLEGVARIPGTDLVALTIEPAGGSEGPTTAPVVVGQLGSPLAWADGVLIALTR